MGQWKGSPIRRMAVPVEDVAGDAGTVVRRWQDVRPQVAPSAPPAVVIELDALSQDLDRVRLRAARARRLMEPLLAEADGRTWPPHGKAA